jgi:biopolymer transport protein ExbD
MSAGGSNSGLTNEPNVTPMIDVLLVLLIIFMMVIPMSRKAIDTQLPDPTPQPATNQKPPDQIILEVLPGGRFMINKNPVERPALLGRIKEIYNGRPEKVIFIKGDTSVVYNDVIFAMDQARGGGAVIIGIPSKDKS